jgi:hypothetical protein
MTLTGRLRAAGCELPPTLPRRGSGCPPGRVPIRRGTTRTRCTSRPATPRVPATTSARDPNRQVARRDREALPSCTLRRLPSRRLPGAGTIRVLRPGLHRLSEPGSPTLAAIVGQTSRSEPIKFASLYSGHSGQPKSSPCVDIVCRPTPPAPNYAADLDTAGSARRVYKKRTTRCLIWHRGRQDGARREQRRFVRVGPRRAGIGAPGAPPPPPLLREPRARGV